ncbi:ubiquitin carboxyl-terminal hydrolase [Aspergillus homomorphus CBS 101889]|uniref:UCH-domain-containing protein n=1 Tax=Aspergillus homomorphus (strain CBS 101889) TaxID=1450537 RepID=A0A395HT84_ASPHC|nr:UCH-domain-containing protein [Aspergillus homomorphus CBS 101889]RAL10766.1 UCH-domain-containing protein [Aspergillus homomorphus CBS 101889]
MDMAHYQLYAFVSHLGSNIDSGHYICFAESPHGQWASFNDDAVSAKTVSDLKSSDEIRKDVYLLAYRRTEPLPEQWASPAATRHVDKDSPATRPSSGVTLDETIKFEGRTVQWTFKQQLTPPAECESLVQLRSAKARVQQAQVKIKLTSTTGEVLEGQGTIPLRPDIIPAQPVSKTNRTAKPRGVIKKKLPKPKVSLGSPPFTRSAAKRNQQKRGVAG